uniref:Uncharacterized protein n=1 Tax=Rhipicephalus microplus TaxID=6941 RepID=A0A6M2DBX0_RHIMP
MFCFFFFFFWFICFIFFVSFLCALSKGAHFFIEVISKSPLFLQTSYRTLCLYIKYYFAELRARRMALQ